MILRALSIQNDSWCKSTRVTTHIDVVVYLYPLLQNQKPLSGFCAPCGFVTGVLGPRRDWEDGGDCAG